MRVFLKGLILLFLGMGSYLLPGAQSTGDTTETKEYPKSDPETEQSTSFLQLKTKAESGDAKAQYDLGFAYFQGDRVGKDSAEALKWIRKAAEQENQDAQAFVVGFAYFSGAAFTREGTEASKLLRKFAKQGNAVAQTFLGLAYNEGLGVKKNIAQAAKWFRKAAEQGNPKAQTYLGRAYFEGKGVTRNYAEAVKWSQKAAEHGDAGARNNLGIFYLNGQGVVQDKVEAVKWFTKAAEQGNGEAQASLGNAYRQSEGVPRDYAQAYKWFDLAAAQGDQNGIAGREELSRQMTPEQLTAAGAVSRRGLTKFDRRIIDAHEQRYALSCIPSSVEMVLKLAARVPPSYYEQQTAWKNKADGSFHDFDGKTIEGVTFHLQFALARDDNFPLAKLYETVDRELKAGRFVIVGLASGPGWHNWVVYDEDAHGEFLAVSKNGTKTIEQRHVKQAIADMHGTDIGTYDIVTGD